MGGRLVHLDCLYKLWSVPPEGLLYTLDIITINYNISRPFYPCLCIRTVKTLLHLGIYIAQESIVREVNNMMNLDCTMYDII